MNYNNLTETDLDFIRRVYETSNSKEEAQSSLAKKYNVTERSIRNWARRMNLNIMKSGMNHKSKILIYDIETSRATAEVWWTGKQYVGSNQIIEEPKIITVSWKWFGEDEVHHLTWDDNHSDEQLVKTFLKEYNKADMVIGFNNNNFDNRWVNARAMKYDFDVNTFVRSLDLMKESKRIFRLLGYSMAFSAMYSGVTMKQGHEGNVMWAKIQRGTIEEQKEYLDKMIEYNKGDIVTTEDLYIRWRKYLGHVIHFGVFHGGEKWSCPNCGGEDVSLYKTTVTPAGTVQRIMQCNVDGVKYKITNKQYMAFLDYKIKEGYED